MILLHSVFRESTSCLGSNISCIPVSFVGVCCLILKLSLTIRLPTSSEYSLELDLARAVVPEQSQVKILSSRVLVCTLYVFLLMAIALLYFVVIISILIYCSTAQL